MKFIVLSSPVPVAHEHEIIDSLFKEGLGIFHVHKPDFSKKEIKDFIEQISTGYQHKVSLHSSFPKFHSLQELDEYKKTYEYAFLSPIFDSISKRGYTSKFRLESHELAQVGKSELMRAIRNRKIIALGGIEENKISLCRELGFLGVAVLGALWNDKDPIEKFKRIKSLCEENTLIKS